MEINEYNHIDNILDLIKSLNDRLTTQEKAVEKLTNIIEKLIISNLNMVNDKEKVY